MFIETMVTACDVKDYQYPEPVKGVAALARGATGRWCQVMWFGPEWLAENPEVKLTSWEEAAAIVEAAGDWVDF